MPGPPTPNITGATVTPPLRHNGPVTRAEFSHDGKRVLTASSDTTVRIWDLEFLHQRLVPTLESPGDGLQAIGASPDGLAFLGKNAVLRPDFPAALACCPQAGFPANLPWAALVLSSNQSDPARKLYLTARTWSMKTGKALFRLLGPEGSTLTDVAFTSDSQFVIAPTYSGEIHSWPVGDAK